MGIVKFSIFLSLTFPVNTEDLYVTVSVISGIFSERLTDTSCQDFSLCFFFLFLQPFFSFDLCHICLLTAKLGFVFKEETVHFIQ